MAKEPSTLDAISYFRWPLLLFEKQEGMEFPMQMAMLDLYPLIMAKSFIANVFNLITLTLLCAVIMKALSSAEY